MLEYLVPVEHIIRDQLHVRGPVILVEDVLEVRASKHLTRIVPRPTPWIERSAYQPRLAQYSQGRRRCARYLGTQACTKARKGLHPRDMNDS